MAEDLCLSPPANVSPFAEKSAEEPECQERTPIDRRLLNLLTLLTTSALRNTLRG
jgi:hypothetical protein